MTVSRAALLCGLAPCVIALSGCTRPGHPDSYGKYQLCTTPNDATCYPGQETAWSTSSKSSDAPPAYKGTDVPFAIWQARGVAWNRHLQYQAAAFKAADVQDWFALPIFGGAVAAIATGIAGAGTSGVAAAGLGGAAVGAGYSYFHPDKDAATDQAAAFELLCVVDESKPLRYMSGVPLILDKAALQDALDQLNADAGPLLAETNPSPSDKQAQTAVEAAQKAAKSTLTDLSNAIDVYNTLPTTMYSTIDQIDFAAKTAGARTLDYSIILASLRQSSAHTQNAANTKSDVGTARTKAADLGSGTIKGASKPGKTVTEVTSPKAFGGETDKARALSKQPPPGSNLANVTSPIPGDAENAADATNGDPATRAKADGKGTDEQGTNQTKTTSLAAILNSTDTNDLQKVNQLSDDAEADIPSPNFAAIQADIEAAPSATATSGCVTPSKATVGAKTPDDSP